MADEEIQGTQETQESGIEDLLAELDAPVVKETVAVEEKPPAVEPPKEEIVEETKEESVKEAPVAEKPEEVKETPVKEQPVKAETAEDRAARVEQVKQMRAQTIETIASNYDVDFTEEETEQLGVDPAPVLKKKLKELLARNFVDVFEAVQQTVASQAPTFIQSEIVRQQVAKQRDDQFFEHWPALKDSKYHEAIRNTTKAYFNVNPNATVEQAIADVGASVMVRYRLESKPVTKTEEKKPPRPFQPATPGGTGTLATSSVPKNEWEELTQQFMEVNE